MLSAVGLFLAGLVCAVLIVVLAKNKPGCGLIIGLPGVIGIIYMAIVFQSVPIESQNSTSSLAIPFGGFWTAVGAIPGWFVGDWLKGKLRRN